MKNVIFFQKPKFKKQGVRASKVSAVLTAFLLMLFVHVCLVPLKIVCESLKKTTE